MIKDVDPMVIGVAGAVLVGMGFSYTNPATRALMMQRDTATKLEQAAVIEARATEAASTITAARQGCTEVSAVSPDVSYQLTPGTAICDGNTTAIIGSDGIPTLIASEVK